MTAISENGTPSSTANPFLRDLVASLRTVQLPGSPAAYANRAYLRDLGLQWDPANHRWHGTTTAERVRELRERLGLVVKRFGDLEAPPKGPAAPKPAVLRPAAAPVAVPTHDPARRPHDGSRTRVETRVAFRAADEDAEEIATPTRRFTPAEITSGLPDDSREEDERAVGRQLRDLRARVKRVRAVVSATPGLNEILRNDWRKAACFYARFGVTETLLRDGVASESSGVPSESAEASALLEARRPTVGGRP